jgi:type VI secretion system secreted protein VgrG
MTDDTRFLTLKTPSGTGPFLVISVEGCERLSQPFEYRLRASCNAQEFSFKLLLGKAVTLGIALDGGGVRYINAIVTRLTLLEVAPRREVATYELELRPFLWLLSLAADCKIFQQLTIPDLVTNLLKDLGFNDVKRSLHGTYTTRDYCVQYRETTLNFVTRVLEEEGIGYFFEHSDSKHTLVLVDSTDSHPTCPSVAKAVFRSEATSSRDNYAIVQCALQSNLSPASIALDSFNFETPATSLRVTSKTQDSGTTMEIYEFLNTYEKTDPGEAIAKRRLEAYEAQVKLLSAEGKCPAFCAGYSFTLSGHERSDVNGKYVLHEVTVTGSQDSYLAKFNAMPSSVPFRPLPSVTKPRIPSTQTAIVVGKTGEEIWVDKYGRVKVQFHWDRLGKKDENSSCWVRVSQGWAGKGWGMLFLPRVGQEVVVSFIDGDPDQPLVTGAIYNAEQTLPYELPGAETKSTIKTQSSKQGSGKNNEIRFEDKSDSEEIFIQAQKDYNLIVKNDVTRQVKHDETVTITNDCKLTVNHDNTITVKNDRTRTVSEGNDALVVQKGTRKVTVKGDETHTNSAQFTHAVDGNYKLSVKGNLTIDVTGALSISAASISMKSNQDGVALQAMQALTMKAGNSLSAEAGTSLSAKSGAATSVEAGTSLSLKAGLNLTAEATMTTVKGSATATVDGGAMLTVKGGLVKIN